MIDLLPQAGAEFPPALALNIACILAERAFIGHLGELHLVLLLIFGHARIQLCRLGGKLPLHLLLLPRPLHNGHELLQNQLLFLRLQGLQLGVRQKKRLFLRGQAPLLCVALFIIFCQKLLQCHTNIQPLLRFRPLLS